MRLTRWAYQQLIDEDIEWLLKQPRTLERDHIEQVLRDSPTRMYGDTQIKLKQESKQ